MTSIKWFILVVSVLGYANVQFVLGLDELATAEPKSFLTERLDELISHLLLSEYQNVPTKELYRFKLTPSDGSYREVVAMLINPGTAKEELLVIGIYRYNDGESDKITLYTIDKNGYQPRELYAIGAISPKLLQSLSG